jgi:site-specific DNA-methyltransferase (adenine-specific)
MINLIHGNCLEQMKNIPDASVDLVLTDPPYKMTKRGKSCRPNWMPNNMGDNVFDGKIPNPKEWMEQCFRVLKDGTHFYTFCNTNDITEYLQVAQDIGFKLHNIITMIKDTGMPNRWYLKNCEFVLFFRKGVAKPINDMTSRDWVKVCMPTKKTGKFHITEKPLSFIQKLVLNSSKENEVVLDCFMGSGTTGVACVNTNRKFIGIEVDDKYFQIAKERITLNPHNNFDTITL